MKRVDMDLGVEVEAWLFPDLKNIDKIEPTLRPFPEIVSDNMKRKSKLLWDYPYGRYIHWDGGSTEIALRITKDLRDLYKVLKDAISQVYEIAEEEHSYYVHSGTNIINGGVAGAHTHLSSDQLDVEKIYDNLRYLQPFIVLLTQNSPYSVGILPSKKDKDCRLLHYDPAPFAEYMTAGLTEDEDFGTIECRFPSDSTFYHLLAVATFLKASNYVTKIDKNISSNKALHEGFTKVKQLGADAPISIRFTRELKYFDIDTDRITIPINKLFEYLITKTEFHEALHIALKELPIKVRTKILEFYKIVCSGYTFSDYLYHHFNTWFEKNYPKVKLSDRDPLLLPKEAYKAYKRHWLEFLHHIGKDSYTRAIPFWRNMDKPNDKRFSTDRGLTKLLTTSVKSGTLLIPSNWNNSEDDFLGFIESDRKIKRMWTK